MSEITVYSTCWCCDCRRAKKFLRERGIAFREVNIDETPEAEEIDQARVRGALERAQADLAKAGSPDVDWQVAAAALERATIRMQAASAGR